MLCMKWSVFGGKQARKSCKRLCIADLTKAGNMTHIQMGCGLPRPARGCLAHLGRLPSPQPALILVVKPQQSSISIVPAPLPYLRYLRPSLPTMCIPAESPTASTASSQSEDTCWICLGDLESEALIRPCACPRPVHASCLSRWSIQQCGKSEEGRGSRPVIPFPAPLGFGMPGAFRASFCSICAM